MSQRKEATHAVVGLEHVGIAVTDIDSAKETFRTLGFTEAWTEDLQDQGVRSHVLQAPGIRVELLESLRDDSQLSRFLARNGQGLHHLCLEVESLNGSLRDAGLERFRFVERTPTADQRGHRVFVHPSSTCGVLIGLVELHPEAAR